MPPTKIVCDAKHVKYEPSEDEWACPFCGANGDDFYIDPEPGDFEAHEECVLLHEADLIVCNNCEKSITGKAFSARLVKKKNLVVCPCCKGKGYVVDDGKSPAKRRDRKDVAR